jgi:hypothetical protein
MTSVNFTIDTCSDTGPLHHHIDCIQSTDRNTFYEVQARELDFELKYPPCPITKVILCVKVSVRVKIDLQYSQKQVARMYNTINCSQEYTSQTLHPADTKTPSNCAKVHIEQIVEGTPVRLVFVLLQTESKEGMENQRNVLPVYGPSASFYDQKNAVKEREESKDNRSLKRPAPIRDPPKPVKAYKAQTGNFMAHVSASPPSISTHLPLDKQPITSPYDHALVGVVVSAITTDPDLAETVPAMVDAMGGLFMSDLDELVQVVVVDHPLSEEEVSRVKRCPQAVAVGWSWLQACQEECEKVDPALYQSD